MREGKDVFLMKKSFNSGEGVESNPCVCVMPNGKRKLIDLKSPSSDNFPVGLGKYLAADWKKQHKRQ